ncbi:MAG: hypothetical protein ACYDBB_26705 [Armatimonadota bacterium]
MSSPLPPTTGNWIATIHEALAGYWHELPFGNLRAETSRWNQAGTQNLAVVYEVPGGSTNQINITYQEATQTFTFLALDTHEECSTASLDDVLRMLLEAVERIPAIRQQRLAEDIDRWAAQGLVSKELFDKINHLLQIEDLRGGTITMPEMKAAIAYIMSNYRSPKS